MNEFIKQKKIGKKGESATKDFFYWQNRNVIDVSENRDFQKIDIDLIVDDEFIEVKTQSGINNKNVITLELNVELQYEDNTVFKQGWFYSTEANKLIFYDKETNTAYQINTDELRKIYRENENEIFIYYFDEESRNGTKISKLAFIDIDFLKTKSKTLEFLDYNVMTA